MKKPVKTLLSMSAAMLAMLPAFAGAAEATGAMLGNACFACHGPDGKSPGAIPGINGKSAEFIVEAMKEFRSGKRESTVMGRHAKGYSDEEIEAMAKYISGLK